MEVDDEAYGHVSQNGEDGNISDNEVDDNDSDTSLDISDNNRICLSDLEPGDDKFETLTKDLETAIGVHNTSDEVPENIFDNSLKKFLNSVKTAIEISVRYKDIDDLLAERRSFLVDGESLLACSMYKSCLDRLDGGQMLHCVYICERILQMFTRIGITYEIVFFDIWEEVWGDKPTILLTRSAMKNHFKYNTGLKVHEVDTIWSTNFKHILDKVRPSFMLCNFSVEEYLPVFTERNQRNFKALAYANIFYSVGQGVPCVDFDKITLEVSTVNGFIIDLPPVSDKILLKTSQLLNNLIKMDKVVHILEETPFVINNVRHSLYISSSAQYLKQNTRIDAEALVRILLFKCALLDILTLKFRAFTCTAMDIPLEVSNFIIDIHKIMHNLIKNWSHSDNCFVCVPDIWQGNLLSKLLLLLRNITIKEKNELGTPLEEIYIHLINKVSDVRGAILQPFPITSGKLHWCQKIIVEEKQCEQTCIENSTLANVGQLLPTSCSLTQEFCGDIVLNCLNTMQCRKLKFFITRNKNFKEKYHWHSKKKLIDDFDKVPDNNQNLKDKYAHSRFAKERVLKNQALFAKYMNIYGSNLEGKVIQAETIVRGVKQSDKSQSTGKSKVYHQKKSAKPSKADVIRMENAKRLQNKNYDIDKQLFKKHFQNIKDLIASFRYDSALIEANYLEQNLRSELFKSETLLMKAKILHKCVLFIFQADGGNTSTFIERCKELFLVLRQILIDSESLYSLTNEQKKEIGYYLACLKMQDISNTWNLGYVCDSNKITTIDTKLTWAEFQLKHLSPHLLRENSSEIDAELGFAPDDWQKTLINCIRERQSAVVVAPTSSGKTFASYYCMKSILQQGSEGIVVYVCPTKALVNQVAATVYARFKNVKMPPGQSVYGVFTRDYREYAMNCQILITVPECMELLLLSPTMCSWVSRLRYMIFDEIHCLCGIAGGLSWEIGLLLANCPFLALSATVEQPEILHNWLQESMNFKRMRDMKNNCKREDSQYKVVLIVHNERHNDLKKFIYIHKGSLTHLHPYACLTNEIVEIHKGIPLHLSLSPEETLSLFNTMKETKQRHTNLDHLQPEVYFKTKSRKCFITKSTAKEYEEELRELLSKWAQDFNDSFSFVINHLKNDVQQLECNLKKYELVTQLSGLVETLQKKQMFPAIIFSFDRCLLEIFLNTLNQHFGNKYAKVQAITVESDGEKRATNKKNSNVSATIKKNSNVSLGLLDGESPSVRNVGSVDRDDLKYIEHRLIRKDYKESDQFVVGLRNGIGIHHSGLDRVTRTTVEMLFRMKVLNVVLATSTLALGIHMPCKTVVVVRDSMFLTPLNYHQMSGRAGRRGFDIEGNVVFWGIKETKIQNLLNGKLPVMRGNFPMSVTLVLRLLLLVSNCRKFSSAKDKSMESVEANTLSRVLTFLNCCLMYQNTPELKQQMKHFFAFSTQLLMIQQILDDDGNPQHIYTGLVTHLHYHEPGNLVFVYLLRKGILHEICILDEDGKVSKETQLAVVLLMSHLFTQMKLHNYVAKNSVVKLPELPPKILQAIEQYNEEVKFVFDHYFRCVGEECARTMGEDNILPISKICISPDSTYLQKLRGNGNPILQEILANSNPPVICSAFAALSGCNDHGLFSETDKVSNLRHEVFTDCKKIVPLFNPNEALNAYAWDFYNHGIRKAIIRDNGLRSGDDWKYLKDFMLVLLSVCTSMECCDKNCKNDAVVKTFRTVANNFKEKFEKAYQSYN